MKLRPAHPLYSSDFIPHLPKGQEKLDFVKAGHTAQFRVGRNSELYIRAAASIELFPSLGRTIQVHVNGNTDLFSVFTTGNALFVFGDLSLRNDKTATRIRIAVPQDLLILGLSLPKNHSFFQSSVCPFFTNAYVTSHSVVRMKTHNLFLQTARQPHIMVTMEPLGKGAAITDFDGDMTVFAGGGTCLIEGRYNDAQFHLFGSSVISNDAVASGGTEVLHAQSGVCKFFQNPENDANTRFEKVARAKLASPERVRTAYIAMRRGLGL